MYIFISTESKMSREEKETIIYMHIYFYKYINVILHNILNDYQNYNTWKNTNEDITRIQKYKCIKIKNSQKA